MLITTIVTSKFDYVHTLVTFIRYILFKHHIEKICLHFEIFILFCTLFLLLLLQFQILLSKFQCNVNRLNTVLVIFTAIYPICILALVLLACFVATKTKLYNFSHWKISFNRDRYSLHKYCKVKVKKEHGCLHFYTMIGGCHRENHFWVACASLLKSNCDALLEII